MECLDANTVAEHLAGELSAAEAQRVEDHVDTCEACRMLLRELSRTRLVEEAVEAAGSRAAPPLRLEERIGRYVLLEWLGAGGMGVVYSAYDPELDRKVALKFLHAGEDGAGERSLSLSPEHARSLLREAKALARVSHPNVVGIHDAGQHGERVFLVMELVLGRTLAAWIDEEPRPWREVLAHYLQAGRGLAAAHAANVIHRDFKAANVLVGSDGVVRVTDFGLARTEAGAIAADGAIVPPSSRRARRGGDPTHGIAGTPAYMAPEQHAGVATARSDQFSFCVALYEALYGQRPYADDDAKAVRDAPRDTRVPSWVRACLLRGLRRDPEGRYPSMDALLAALERDPGQIARRRAKWSLVPLALAAMLAMVVRAERRENATCRGAEQKLAGIWDDDRRGLVHRAFLATGAPYAEGTWRQTEAALDAYATSWVKMHTDACEATQLRKEQSQELLDLRIDCLGGRLKELRAATDLFTHADEATVEKAVGIAQSLRRLDGCADAAALRSGVPLPSDPAVRAKADAVTRKLAEARVLDQAGKYDAAFGAARAASDEARAMALTPVLADALFLTGRIDLELGHEETAAAFLEDAIRTSERAHDDRTRAAAWSELVMLLGYRQTKYAEADRAAGFAEAALERAGGDPELRAGLEDRLSSVSYRRGQFEPARAHLKTALDLLSAALPAGDVRIAELLYHLSLTEGAMGHHEESLALNERALAIWETALGSEHPSVARSLNQRAVKLATLNRHQESLGFAERALAIFQKGRPPVPRLVAAGETNVAIAQDGIGRHEEARAHLERALAIDEATFGREHPETAIALAYLAQVSRHLGRWDEAIAYDTRALAIWQPKEGPAHPNRSGALAGLGESYLGLGQPKRAVDLLERAVVAESAVDRESFDLARMQLALARALWDGGGDRARAHTLATQAGEIYGKSAAYAKQAAAARAWAGGH